MDFWQTLTPRHSQDHFGAGDINQTIHPPFCYDYGAQNTKRLYSSSAPSISSSTSSSFLNVSSGTEYNRIMGCRK